jgi:hypothetical protein
LLNIVVSPLGLLGFDPFGAIRTGVIAVLMLLDMPRVSPHRQLSEMINHWVEVLIARRV